MPNLENLVSSIHLHYGSLVYLSPNTVVFMRSFGSSSILVSCRHGRKYDLAMLVHRTLIVRGGASSFIITRVVNTPFSLAPQHGSLVPTNAASKDTPPTEVKDANVRDVNVCRGSCQREDGE